MMKKILDVSIRLCLLFALVFCYFITPDVAQAATAETLGDLRR